MMRASFILPMWRLPNIQIQPTMESLQVTLRKSPCTPLYLPLTPPSPVGVPQFHPNWMESLMYRRLASLYGCSVHWMIAHPSQRPMWPLEQSVGVTLYCQCPQTWGGDIVTTWIVPIQVNLVNFKMKQLQQILLKVSIFNMLLESEEGQIGKGTRT